VRAWRRWIEHVIHSWLVVKDVMTTESKNKQYRGLGDPHSEYVVAMGQIQKL
jgi:hypothetical protein